MMRVRGKGEVKVASGAMRWQGLTEVSTVKGNSYNSLL